MPSFGELSILHEAPSTTLRGPFQEKVRAFWKKHLDLSGRNFTFQNAGISLENLSNAADLLNLHDSEEDKL